MPQLIISQNLTDHGFSLQGFDCEKLPYSKIEQIKSFNVSGQFIAYASPDSTYAVTKKLFNEAKEEILIGIYDFGAHYIKELLLNAMERNVKVTLMLDLDSKKEKEIFDELKRFGCKTVQAPSCKNPSARYFPNCHEKFIIIDNKILLVQSGNYSKNSIPFNEEDGGNPEHFKKGNRDMGVAIESEELCNFFKGLLHSDIKLVEDRLSPQFLGNIFPERPVLVDFVPQLNPIRLFPSKTFVPSNPVKVQPVLSPDNYMDKITSLLSLAQKSIFIENQYIRSNQPQVQKLLQAIKIAKQNNSALDVKIILGKLFDADDFPKEQNNIKILKDDYNLELGENIRYIDTQRFVHCHNKLIIVDDETVLISSQNWSDTAVSQNREAGLILYYPEIASYYNDIFESDWSTALKQIPNPGGNQISPQAVSDGNYTEVSIGDYKEV